MKRAGLVFLLSLFSFVTASKPAHAVSIGDAALTVVVATAAGAGLGASTLPFYDDSGAHTQNIFIGAAVGAVIGVFVMAAAGVKEGDTGASDEASAAKRRWELQMARNARFTPDAGALTSLSAKRAAPVVAAQLVSARF